MYTSWSTCQSHRPPVRHDDHVSITRSAALHAHLVHLLPGAPQQDSASSFSSSGCGS
uniref:Uncharacterized protein n=1 Tax=Arundo donax TaxID=35708 RepID=A0A0A9HD34_ARUDO